MVNEGEVEIIVDVVIDFFYKNFVSVIELNIVIILIDGILILGFERFLNWYYCFLFWLD